MSVDVEMAKAEHHLNALSYASFNMYFLAHAPEAEMQKNYALFGKGNLMSQIEGVWISVKQTSKD